ncbi:hypothetical protein K1719_025451 [Acacia pycnantha]|nr:hypothetical protein K1719_025451 [Acacia pycnantha]
MPAMDRIRSCKALPYYMPGPYYLPSSPKPSALAPPFSANGVSIPPFVDSADFEDSHNYCYGYGSCLKPLGESYSEPFSKRLCGFSQGYSGFQSMDPLSSQFARDTSPDWLSLDNLNTKPREIDNPCQSPRVWNQILEFNIRNQGHVEGPEGDGAYFLSKINEAWNNIDECNPAVYPPCWNGAPAAHYPVFGAYEPLHPELIDKIEEFLIASYLEGPKDFHVELATYGGESCEISTKNKVQNEIGSQEKGSTGLVTKFPVSNSVSQECNSYGAVNDGRSGVGKQVIEENQFMSRNQNSLCRCRCVGFNVSECLECSLSQEAANGLSSPPFMAGAPEKAPARAPAPKLDIELLVQAMHNMSELLLDQCSTDEFQLNEQDHSMLENVIGNLRACTLIKDAEQIIPAQKHLFPELGTGNLGGQSPQLQQNSRVKEPHISKAMKSVFSENFREEEKSAWHTMPYGIMVDVEADELCSLINGAPFNQMMEVEKYSSKQGDNALLKGVQSKTQSDFKFSPDQNSAEEVNSSHSAEHTSAMHAAANLPEPCGLELSANPNEPIASENEGKGTQMADDYAVFGTNKEAEQDEGNEEDVSNSGDVRALDMAFEGTDDSLNAEAQDNTDADVEESDFDSSETLDSSADADDEESDLDSEDNEEMQPSYGPRFGVEHVPSDDSSSDWELVMKD